jgi:RNA polymerase sigma-70 factor (ECF subfamily)
MFRRCLRILGRHEEAADACQDVFVRILRHRDRLPPPGEQLRWAYAIATRICLNRLRDGAWETPAELKPEELPPDAGGLDGVAERDLASGILASHDELTRALAWLVFVDGHTHQEAGALVGVSRKTVGKRLRRFCASARVHVKRSGLRTARAL